MSGLSYEKEFGKAVEAVLSKVQIPPKPEVGDVKTRRENTNKLMSELMAKLPSASDVDKALVGHAKSHDGHDVAIYRFKKETPSIVSPGPAIVYCHGGGYFCLSVDIYQPLLKYYVSQSGVPIYAMEYRLPPEHPFPSPVEDCYAGLKFVQNNAAGLDIDPFRIILMGDSAGGGLCAGTAILARDRGLPVAKQIVIHGNLDDRTVDPKAFPELAEFASWGVEDNITGWNAYLGEGHESKDETPPAAAPSRITDLTGLAPLYLDVPALDILRDEGIKYASRVAETGIPVELHVYPGVPHGFELFTPNIAMAKMVMQNRIRAIKSV